MHLTGDNVYSSKAMLHIRVHVTGKDGQWSQKHYIGVPLEDIPEEALQHLFEFYKIDLGIPVPEDIPLF